MRDHESPGPRPSTSQLRELDRICREFDSDWQTDSFRHIAPRLESVPDDLRQTLAEELISIDLERSRAAGMLREPAAYQPAWRWENGVLDAMCREMAPPPPRVPPQSLPDTAHDLPVSTPPRFGEYEIVREVGRGGMGIVYEAIQPSLNRPVAIKVMSFAALLKRGARERFAVEAAIIGKLHHSHIVRIYGIGEQAGIPYFVMEYVEGVPLSSFVNTFPAGRGNDVDSSKRSGLSSMPKLPLADGSADRFKRIARIGVQIADALQFAHDRGVLHRDVKPANILIQPDGNARLTDFGLARFVDRPPGQTLTDDFVGTMRYVAPEGLRLHADARSDIYSLGVTLTELVTGRPLFSAPDLSSLVLQIEKGSHPDLWKQVPELPRELGAILLKATSLEPERRYATARELQLDLQRFLDGEPVLARRASAVRRLALWCRRFPVLATLLAAVIILAFGEAITASMFWRYAEGEAERARGDSYLAAQAQVRALQAEEQLRRQLLERIEERFVSRLEQGDAFAAMKSAGEATALLQRAGEYQMGRQELELWSARIDGLASRVPRRLASASLIGLEVFPSVAIRPADDAVGLNAAAKPTRAWLISNDVDPPALWTPGKPIRRAAMPPGESVLLNGADALVQTTGEGGPTWRLHSLFEGRKPVDLPRAPEDLEVAAFALTPHSSHVVGLVRRTEGMGLVVWDEAGKRSEGFREIEPAETGEPAQRPRLHASPCGRFVSIRGTDGCHVLEIVAPQREFRLAGSTEVIFDRTGDQWAVLRPGKISLHRAGADKPFLECAVPQRQVVVNAVFSRDGQRLAAITESRNRVIVWETQTGDPILLKDLPQAYLVGVDLSDDHRLIVTVDRSGLVQTTSIDFGIPVIPSVSLSEGAAVAIESIAAGYQLAVVAPGEVALWSDGFEHQELGENDHLRSLAFAPDNLSLVKHTESGELLVAKEAVGGRVLESLRIKDAAGWAWNSLGTRLAILLHGPGKGEFRIRLEERVGTDFRTAGTSDPFRCDSQIPVMTFEGNDIHVLTDEGIGAERNSIYDAATLKSRPRAIGQPTRQAASKPSELDAVLEYGLGCAITRLDDQLEVEVWDSLSGKAIRRARLKIPDQHLEPPTFVSEDRVLIRGERSVHLWNYLTGQLRTLLTAEEGARLQAVSPNYYATQREVRTIVVHNLDLPELSPTVVPIDSSISEIQILPDETSLLTVSERKVVRLYDLRTGRLLTGDLGCGQTIRCLAVSANSRHLSMNFEDGRTVVVDLPERQPVPKRPEPAVAEEEAAAETTD